MSLSTRTSMRSALAAAILVAGAVACSGKSSTPTLASDLQGDLEAAQSSSIELANDGTRRTQVVSAEELTGGTAVRAPQTAPQTAPRAVAQKATTSRAPAPAVAPAAPSVVAPAPVPPVVNADTLAPIQPRPAPSRPAATPARRGGYKSVGDIIRDAPFPINP